MIFIDVPGTGGKAGDTVMLYGHLDKQPEMTGWREGLGPWTPVIEGDKLYGRGGADDGYAIFASLTAINALRQRQASRTRAASILIEACEESGSYDLPAYIDHLAPRIGELVARRVPRLGLRELRPAVVDDVAARPRASARSRSRCSPRACTRATAPAWSPRASASCASCSIASTTATPASIKLAELSTPDPARSASLQAERPRRCIGDEVWSKFPLQPGVRAGRRRTTPS